VGERRVKESININILLDEAVISFVVFPTCDQSVSNVQRMGCYESLVENTYIGFFICFSSSSVFQYCRQLYLGLLLPIKRILRMRGSLRMLLARLSSAARCGSSKLSRPRRIAKPASSSLGVDGSRPATIDEERRCCVFAAREVADRDLMRLLRVPLPCVAIGLLSSLNGRKPRRRPMRTDFGGEEL